MRRSLTPEVPVVHHWYLAVLWLTLEWPTFLGGQLPFAGGSDHSHTKQLHKKITMGREEWVHKITYQVIKHC